MKLSVALGVKESAKVIKDAKFKEFLFNKPTWVNVIDLKEIDEQLKEVESVEPKENAEANLANFILDKYKSNTKIPNPERQFVRVFFDLMCAVSSIYKESLPTVYSAYFKAFMKGNVLKIELSLLKILFAEPTVTLGLTLISLASNRFILNGCV